MDENILIIACTKETISSWEGNEEQNPASLVFTTMILEELSGDIGSIKKALQDKDYIAVILVIEKAWLAKPVFLNLVETLLSKISSREDFRLYVLLADLSMQEFNTFAGKPKADVLADLVDTVQLSQFKDIYEVLDQLKDYKKRRRNIRLGMTGKRISIAAANIAIFFSWIIESICLAFIILYALSHLLKFNLPFAETFRPLFAFSAGLIVFPISLYIIYILSNLAKEGKNFIFMVIGWGLIIEGIYIVKDTPGLVQLYILSILFGIVLEFFRRTSYADRRLLTKIDVNQATPPNQKLPAIVHNAIEGINTNPFSCPIFTDQRPILFLSYTRRSEWGKKLAQKLNREFQTLQSENFLDVADIQTGSNWRQALNNGFGKTNAFISLIDEFSPIRNWPAAEIECALKTESKYSIPRIIILKKKGVDVAKIQNIYPVFQEIFNLSPEAVTPLQPSIIEINDADDPKVDILTSQLRFPEFETPSVVPPYVDSIIKSPFQFLLKPLGFLSMVAWNLGWLPGLLAIVFPAINKFMVGLALTNWNLPIKILLGYVFGSLIRYIFGLIFEYKMRFSHWRFVPYSLLGVTYLLYLVMPHAQLFDIGYTILAACLGWLFVIDQESKASHSKNISAMDLSESDSQAVP